VPMTLATAWKSYERYAPCSREGILHHAEGVDLMPANIDCPASKCRWSTPGRRRYCSNPGTGPILPSRAWNSFCRPSAG
jgi:hypothetical protein